jgi:hypothetical protein
VNFDRVFNLISKGRWFSIISPIIYQPGWRPSLRWAARVLGVYAIAALCGGMFFVIYAAFLAFFLAPTWSPLRSGCVFAREFTISISCVSAHGTGRAASRINAYYGKQPKSFAKYSPRMW